MAVTTVAQFAAEIRTSVSTVLEQLQHAGVSKGSDRDPLTEADKERLLAYLRTLHGTVGRDRKKITLTKKSTSEMKQDGASGEARTIQVEAGKQRNFVKREDFISGALALESFTTGEVEEAHARNRAEAQASAAAEVAALRAATDARRRGAGTGGTQHSGASLVASEVKTDTPDVFARGLKKELSQQKRLVERRISGERTFPDPFPPDCATAWGDDRFGLWFEIVVGGITQRLRWIEPGTFWMGSQKNENWHSSDEEPRHLVTLTSGFWLADTACPQDFWQAVTGENMSRFQSDQRNPVENVSRVDVSELFLPELSRHLTCMVAELPTEAQWEYACRAGSETPYWFGESIDPSQARYESESTVPVKALPANKWGLYQMHGNVWEWCRGSARKYEALVAVDPPDEQGGGSCVLRGGAWHLEAGWLRSAHRNMSPKTTRSGGMGFRFSLRPI